MIFADLCSLVAGCGLVNLCMGGCETMSVIHVCAIAPSATMTHWIEKDCSLEDILGDCILVVV